MSWREKMSKRTYEEYIKNDCHPVGYNEPCQSYFFGQTSVDLLLDRIDQLKQQLVEKDKEIESIKQQLEETNAGYDFTYEQSSEAIKELKQNQTQLAIKELEKVNSILTETIIEVTQDEFDLNRLCYLEEISAKFFEKIQQQISELKDKKKD